MEIAILYTIILFLISKFFFSTGSDSSSNEIPTKPQNKVKYYWNIPTFQCDTHKLNFSELASKFQIIQNENDRFWGEEITILYDPGDFPAILKNNTNTILRNGGLPQLGNLTLHLEIFSEYIGKLIPNPHFSGLAVIDFESWRPIFRQNFNSLALYKDLSIETERKNHPLWPKILVEIEARKKFEFHARKFMEETLAVAKILRSNATWGYYAYPYCFNMSPNNMRMECPPEVVKENSQLAWLFNSSDNFYPSLYLSGLRLNSKEKHDLIEGRVLEAHRMASFVKTAERSPKIIPYFWYKYHDSKAFVSKEDLFMSFVLLSTLDIDGLIIWGSSNDVNTKQKCVDLYNYIDTILGPSLLHNFN